MKAQSQLDDLPERKRIYWSRVLHDLLEGVPGGRLRDEHDRAGGARRTC